MSEAFSVDPRLLGKILLIQTTAHAIPTAEALAGFICRGLIGLPGVKTVLVRMGEVCQSEPPDVIVDGEPGNTNPHRARQGESDALNVPISTLHRHYGAITIECGDLGVVVPYEPFLNSLANTIALTIENRRHAESLEQLNRDLTRSKEGLESVVRERTAELLQINEELARQIEERTKYSQQLRESEVKYRDLFENASDAILLLDMDENYIDVNRKAVEIFGYSHEEFLHKNFRDLEPGGDLSPTVSEGDDVDRVSTRQRTKDGRVLDVEISSSPVLVEGSVCGYRHIVRDVTAQRKMEAALRRAIKTEAIGTLASGIAHDFNNILTAIICSSELASDQLPEDHPARADLQRILGAGARASELVKQILTFSRPATDERKPLLLQPIVKECIKFLQASLPTSIEIVKDIGPDVPMVLGDATQFHQVLMNLCTNAYQAMPDLSGVLKVSLRKAQPEPEGDTIRSEPQVLLEVSDTGCGIEPAVLEKIFDPYFTTKERDKGTGLGLSVVQGIVSSFGGYIRVTSRPGSGSIFQVFLPALASAERHSARDEKRLLRRGTERVWVVDDEPSIAEIERDMLRALGYEARSFTRGTDLVAALRATPDQCDLVISDIGMPNMDGAGLVREVQLIRPELPIILCTGYSSSLTSAAAGAMGAREYVMKPLDFERISAAVRRALDGIASTEPVAHD